MSAAEEATTDESRGSSQEPLSMASVTSGPPAVDEKVSVCESGKAQNESLIAPFQIGRARKIPVMCDGICLKSAPFLAPLCVLD